MPGTCNLSGTEAVYNYETLTLTMKKTINLWGWALTLSMFLFAVTGAQADPIVKKTRSVENFSGIKVGGAFNLVLKQGNSYKLVVEAEDDLHDDIRTRVKGDILYIDIDWDWSWKNHDKITIYVDFVDLNYLNVSGAADVRAESSIKTGDMELEVSGAGDIELELYARSLDVEVSGAGDLELSGSTEKQNVRLSGAGDYKAADLKSNYTQAKASGAGTVIVHASEEIEAYASGAGSVRFYGNPPKQKTSSSGAGSVSKR